MAGAWSAVTLISGGFALHAGPFALSSRDPFAAAPRRVRPARGRPAPALPARRVRPDRRRLAGDAIGSRRGLPRRRRWRAGLSIAWTYARGRRVGLLVLRASGGGVCPRRVTLAIPLPCVPSRRAAGPVRADRLRAVPRAPCEAVPICGPGLALVMAGALAGPPRRGLSRRPAVRGAPVWLTFVFGRRLDDEVTGASAAVLLACSPIFLYQAVQPMSDVPAAALWLAALVSRSAREAIGVARSSAASAPRSPC